jgi:hypothetical protein
MYSSLKQAVWKAYAKLMQGLCFLYPDKTLIQLDPDLTDSTAGFVDKPFLVLIFRLTLRKIAEE